MRLGTPTKDPALIGDETCRSIVYSARVQKTCARNHLRGCSSWQTNYLERAEKNLDRPLEFTDVALPKLPADYAAPAGKPVKVFVSFYIDEAGKVHSPRVESAVAPELVAGALKVAVNVPCTPNGLAMLRCRVPLCTRLISA